MRDTATGAAARSATDWSAHDTPSMWRMLAPQQTEAHWRHVAGLRKLTELTATHMARLQVYRDHLASAWPPEKSPAAHAFIARLDYLISHVRATHEVAATNYSALTTATMTLDSARTRVASINAEYAAKFQALKDYDALIESTKVSQLPGTTIGPPPVAAADLETLNAKARTVMADLSHTLVLAQTQLRQPTRYGSRAAREEPQTRLRSRPNIPAVRLLEPPPRSPVYTGFERTNASEMRVPRQELARSILPQPPPDKSSWGVAAEATSVPVPTTTPAAFVRPDLRAPPTSGGSNGQSVNRPRGVLPSGGIIGTTAPSAGPQAAGAGRPNPPGGVIAGSQPSTVAQQRGQSKNNNIRRRDPDTTWDVRQGVPPIVIPPVIQSEVDPGPAIGLAQ